MPGSVCDVRDDQLIQSLDQVRVAKAVLRHCQCAGLPGKPLLRSLASAFLIVVASGQAMAEQAPLRAAKGDLQSVAVLGTGQYDVSPALIPALVDVDDLRASAIIRPAADVPLVTEFQPISERSPFASGLPFPERVERLFIRRDATDFSGYDAKQFYRQSLSVPWDFAALFGGITYLGIKSWNWGSSEFRFNSEGWFGEDTGSMGMDKLGHAYTTYLMSEYLTQRILQEAEDPRGAAFTAAILAMGLQTYVEIFDGFSGDHGFSNEDMVADAAGAIFSVLRSTVPGMADKLDFRMEYIPSGNAKVSPVSDYSGQKYLLALKLSGFEKLEETPLKFLELQAGYYARGFTDEEEANGDELRREPYVAVGINLQQVFARWDSVPSLVVQRGLEYVQVPYTYIATSQQ